MYDMNVMPYPADDERNTLIDDDGVLRTATADTHYVFGDTPGYRRTGVTDTDAAGPDARIISRRTIHGGVPTTAMHGEHGYIHIDAPTVDADHEAERYRVAGDWS